MPRRAVIVALMTAIAVWGAGCADRVAIPPEAAAAAGRVEGPRIRDAMFELGADAMEGRGTGSPGYDRAAAWLVERLEALGAEPAGEDGSFLQPVPLVAARLIEDESSIVWERDGATDVWQVGRDALLAADPQRLSVELSAPPAFVGYGVHAPELGYDDWSDIDVDGAIVVVFRGAPASFDPALRALHSDRALTRRLAVEHGAVGILWLLTPEALANQPWERTAQAAGRESMERIGADGRPVGAFEQLAVEGLLGDAVARRVLAAAGLELDATVADLDAGTPHSRPLPGRIDVRTASVQRRLESPNVVARIPGSDAELAREHVAMTAHLDHLGVAEPEDGDAIYNGTYDNASGVATLLEVARVVARSETRPARSLLLLAVTGEERGLLGSAHWLDHPTVPLDGVVADINLDMVLMLTPLRDVIPFGAEHSTLGPIVRAAADREGITLVPDPFPDETIFLRSDQMSFVRRGIPALFLWSGVHDGTSRESGLARFREWMRETYHSPRDDNDQPVDVEAAAAMARLHVLIAWTVAATPARPTWNEGDPLGERFGG